MAKLPYHFQGVITPDNLDPNVSVFMGEMYTNDDTGEKTIVQLPEPPQTVKLSELQTMITTSYGAAGATTAKRK